MYEYVSTVPGYDMFLRVLVYFSLNLTLVKIQASRL